MIREKMAKKLRDSAYVNDLVLYRNACEEKKLKFTLTQLENLKSVYQRQKEQEKMFFAVQHMAVPVKTDGVILNLRRSLGKNQTQPTSILQNGHDGGLSRNASRVTFRDERARNSARNSSNRKNPSRTTSHGRANSGTSQISRVTSEDHTDPQPPKNNPKKPNSHAKNIRVISPSHKKVNQMNSSRLRSSDGSVKKRTPHFKQYEESTHFDEETLLNEQEIITLDNQERARSILESLGSRRGSSWGPEMSRHEAFAPRFTDLPPLDINIYENPCSEKDSRDKWQTLVTVLKNSSIEEKRSEVELTKYNQEIRRKWQNTYNEIKRDRISAMIKDKMRINDGKQLTLVKFLPKSRQSDFIKEAQLAQHKV